MKNCCVLFVFQKVLVSTIDIRKKEENNVLYYFSLFAVAFTTFAQILQDLIAFLDDKNGIFTKKCSLINTCPCQKATFQSEKYRTFSSDFFTWDAEAIT